MIAQAFKWSQDGVILLDVLVEGNPARAVYDPGCVGIAVSKWYAAKVGLVPQEQVTMTVASAEGTTTLDRGVFHRLRIKWNNTIANLPAVVLPGVGFDVLLGMSWIKSVGVCLDVTKGCLLHEGREHAYQQLSVPEVPLHPTKVAVYADKRVVVPPGERAELQAAPFDQGHLGGIVQAELDSGLMVSLPIYLDAHVCGELAPWTVRNTTTAPMTIEAASRIGTWTAIQEIVPTNKLPATA